MGTFSDYIVFVKQPRTSLQEKESKMKLIYFSLVLWVDPAKITGPSDRGKRSVVSVSPSVFHVQ